MRVIYDSQIFQLQKFGGISRYFCELAPRVATRPCYWARILAPNHINGYVSALPPGTLIGWRKPDRNSVLRVSETAGDIVTRAVINAARPGVIHRTYYSKQLAPPRGAKTVLTIYDMIHELYPEQFNDRTAEYKRLAAADADHVICISNATRTDAQRILGIPDHKLSVTHLAASMPAISPAGSQPPIEGPYLLYVGRRSGYKNFANVLRAMGASPGLKDWTLVCFGGGALNVEERLLCEQVGFRPEKLVVTAGSDGALANLYAYATAFIYPSLYEGFGIPPLEAMQCGCPVICARAGSIPEVVGTAGQFFEPGDVSEMRTAIESVAFSRTRQAELRKLGTSRAAQFSWDRCAEETTKVYGLVTR